MHNNEARLFRGISIAQIAKKGTVIALETTTATVVKMFEEFSDLQSLVVLENKKPVGLVVRERLYSRLATQYGYAVFMGRSIKTIMDENPLKVNDCEFIEDVSKSAMERDISRVYNCIIVVNKDGEYCGIVSIRNLLEKLASLQIEHAKSLNPLTSLPGNRIIDMLISQKIITNTPFSVLYIDLNCFKSYNDTYGYKKGDEVLLFTAELLSKIVEDTTEQSGFVGHIGGDDFIIISNPEIDTLISEKIISEFDLKIKDFYSDEDWNNGFVIATDRKGKVSHRPLVSISISIVANDSNAFVSPLEISELAAEIKHHVKSLGKSAYLKERRQYK